MTPIVDNASLSTDLDCQFNDLQKILHFYPTPLGLVQLTDPRLSDPRNMLPGSVINESVAGNAAIVQSKLNLNGVIPPNWFAPAPDIDIPAPLIFPVRGDLAELLPRKGAPNGYAAIDSNRRLLPANVTPGPGLGTVSEVIFSFPDQFTEMAPGAGAAVSYNLTWRNVPDNCWFGINGDTGLPSGSGPGITTMDPQFYVDQLPIELLPAIDAAKFTTGLFDPEVLPIAEFGEDHHPGMVPDPGLQGDPNDYLGRDMDWHHFLSGPPYQPQVATPSIELISMQGNIATITIRSREPGSVLFYRAGRPSFVEAPGTEITIQLPRGILIEAYAAKQGYNNSNVASYTVSVDPDLPSIIDSVGNNISAAGEA
jgi:hypothetical protein